MGQKHFSRISKLHYFKLVYRSALFLYALITYIMIEPMHHITFAEGAPQYWPILQILWVVFFIEMLLRFFPSKLESMGCQKQFARNYKPSGAPYVHRKEDIRGVLLVIVSWLLLNGAIAALYYAGIIGDGILILAAGFYSVSDMICILFFCPFQSWMMHNRCCATCRIYNWDYLMMFTPLILIKSLYTWSLVGLSLLLFIRWEVTAHLYPERFDFRTNSCLYCSNCNEKLCHHKTQLHRLWKKLAGIIEPKL